MALNVYRAPLMAADVLSDPADHRQADLAQVVQAYNEVTDKLQKSHEALGAEVNR